MQRSTSNSVVAKVNAKDYEDFVDQGVMLDHNTTRERLLLGAMGLAGESGEVVDMIKKHVFHNKPLDIDELIKELGDVMWYYTLLLNEIDTDIETVQEENIIKLTERYPNVYKNFGV